MVDANIKPTEEVLAAFNEVKMGKTLRYAIFKIEEDKIVVENKGDNSTTWEEFVKLLPADQPRFGVFDYPYVTDEKPPRHLSKLLFIGWSPDDSAVKVKMTYASSKVSFKNKLGVSKDLQATDLSYKKRRILLLKKLGEKNLLGF